MKAPRNTTTAAVVGLALVTAACGTGATSTTTEAASAAETSATGTTTDDTVSLAATAGTSDVDATATVELGDEITVEGDGVTVDGDVVTIIAAGTYRVTGTLDEGQVVVDAAGETVEVVLDGASITNPQGPALLVLDAGEAVVTLAEGSVNALADGGSSEMDAALWSSPSLTVQGEGALTVDAVYEGIASETHLTIAGGDIHVYAEEDGLNANDDGVSVITVSGGYLYVESVTGDAIDSNGEIVVTGGTVVALGSLDDMSGGLDTDGSVTITGGTVVATGATNTTSGADSTQESLVVAYDGTQSAGTLVSIQQDGEEVLTFAPARDYQHLLFSSGALAEGVTYDVASGGTATGDTRDGLYTDATSSGGTSVTSVTTADPAAGGQSEGPGAAPPERGSAPSRGPGG